MNTVDKINLIVHVLMQVNKEEAFRLMRYFYPKEIDYVSAESVAERWHIIEDAAREVDYEVVNRIMKKLNKAYEKVGEGMVLTAEATYEIVAEALGTSKTVAEDTAIFNRFVQTVVKKSK